LHWACDGGHVPIVRKLLQHRDIQINALDDEQLTPLYRSKDEGVIQELLSHDEIDITFMCPKFGLPFHNACRLGLESKFDLLLLHQSERYKVFQLNARCGEFQDTPLHFACRTISNGGTTVRQLLNHIADLNINAINLKGNTPLHEFCARYDVLFHRDNLLSILLQLLLQPSIRIHSKNFAGQTPLEILQQKDALRYPPYQEILMVMVTSDEAPFLYGKERIAVFTALAELLEVIIPTKQRILMYRFCLKLASILSTE
jgi:ankyrin repeat protein